MSEADPLDQILVLRTHLEGALSVLRVAYGYHVATDLRKQYESGRPNPQYSSLTKQIEGQMKRFEGYLDEEEPSDG